jgi:predicted transcriptional regulator
MSIKPTYSDLIFDGQKRWELRRQPVKLKTADIVLVYASSPTRALVGAFTVLGVVVKPVEELWDEYHEELGITRKEYLAYFEGASTAYAIQVGPTERIVPITLSDLCSIYSKFRPPQSYMYWPMKMDWLLPGCAFKAIYNCTSRIELQRCFRFQYPIMKEVATCRRALSSP